MPRDIRIFLVRHGESEANLDKSLNARLPDHRIPLSPRGHAQAAEAGRILRDLLHDAPPCSVRVWQSPYQRTRETAGHVVRELGEKVRDQHEHIMLRELEFGLFDGVADEELPARYPDEFAHYQKHKAFEGEFFARMPGGESRCDVAQRVHQVFGTFHRDAERHGIHDLVVVSHGVTIRAFVMMWCHKPYEWIEREPNPGNCSIRLISGEGDHGYLHEGHKPSKSLSREERREDAEVAPPPSRGTPVP